jgi:hypothetical protein
MVGSASRPCALHSAHPPLYFNRHWRVRTSQPIDADMGRPTEHHRPSAATHSARRGRRSRDLRDSSSTTPGSSSCCKQLTFPSCVVLHPDSSIIPALCQRGQSVMPCLHWASLHRSFVFAVRTTSAWPLTGAGSIISTVSYELCAHVHGM